MNEWTILEYLLQTRDLLLPLQRESVLTEQEGLAGADAMLTACLRDEPLERFLFLVEVKSKSTPQVVQSAIQQIKICSKKKNDPEMHPMIVVPYLSEERLKELEEAQVSGLDLCGNGIVTIPRRMLIYRTGHKNRYPESRALSNPYRGRSSMVARAFLMQSEYETLGELYEAIQTSGTNLSLSQVSKAVKALEDELIVSSTGRKIRLKDSLRLVDQLGSEWRPPRAAKMGLRLPQPLLALPRLSQSEGLKWSITGESSVTKYTPFGQGRPLQVAVTNISKAWKILDGSPEDIRSFADVELIETSEAGFYFQNDTDSDGLIWASKIQTWIELRNGDARQQDAARDIRAQILKGIS